MELVHSNAYGPINTMSLGKSNYFIIFMDDFSRKFWLFLLKQKSNAFEAFKTFKLMVDKQTRNVLKVLGINRGGEYCFVKFKNLHTKVGFTYKVTIPYTF